MPEHFEKELQRTLEQFKFAEILERLAPVLSPLEKAAMQHNYKPFVYLATEYRVYITGDACKSLLRSAKAKLDLLEGLIDKSNRCYSVPIKFREKLDDPAVIMSLPPTLRNRLCDLECYTLYHLLERGKKYFVEDQKFSVQALKTLDTIFKKYECGDWVY